MPLPIAHASNAPARRGRRLLAAAMAAPVLLQLGLYALGPLLDTGRDAFHARLMAYAASGAAAILVWMLVARLEGARRRLQD